MSRLTKLGGMWLCRISLTAMAYALLPPPAIEGQAAESFERYRESVEPIFIAPRGGHGPGLSPCATCHVHSGTPLELQPLQEGPDGSVFWSVEQSRLNYEAVTRLVVPGDPEGSRLLQTPLAASGGGAPFHVGGKFWQSRDAAEWQAMAEWVIGLGPDEAGAEPAPTIDVGFFQSCVQRVFRDKRPGRMECVHCHGSGTRGFAPEPAEGRESWNEEEARRAFEILRRYLEPGYPMRSRFLTHPLAPEAGGDPYHSGGRRWESQDDVEWRMLAAWVRGEETSCQVGGG